MSVSEQQLFSRYEDGAQPVVVITLPEGGQNYDYLGSRYTTAKGLLAALTGHPEGRHWSIDRYFRQGAKYGSPAPLGMPPVNVLDLLVEAASKPPRLRTSPAISIPKERGLGIDLGKRAHEVKKLLFAGFGRQMFLSGFDPEEVLQEVYKGILVRNAGKCPWDARISTFGHYVHMVISCVLSNYRRKQNRVHGSEQLGLGPEGQDVANYAAISVPALTTLEQSDVLLVEAATDLLKFCRKTPGAESHLATRILPLILAGVPRSELASSLGVSNASVSRSLAFLRMNAAEWQFQDCL